MQQHKGGNMKAEFSEMADALGEAYDKKHARLPPIVGLGLVVLADVILWWAVIKFVL